MEPVTAIDADTAVSADAADTTTDAADFEAALQEGADEIFGTFFFVDIVLDFIQENEE